MNQLTKDLYGNEHTITNCRLFGLTYRQWRSPSLVTNAGWYNKFGEKIGCGDLAIEDFQRISREINDDECFIVLVEEISFKNFHGLKEEYIDVVGKDYITQYAVYIIKKNLFIIVDDSLEQSKMVEKSYVFKQKQNISRKDVILFIS